MLVSLCVSASLRLCGLLGAFVLKSMTGFARASAVNEAYEAVAEIRTVNHRYLEVRLRALGIASAAHEKRIRDRVAKNLGRVQQFGTNSELNRGMNFLTGTYEKTFNSVWSTRVSGNIYAARRWDFNQNVAANQVNQRTLIMQRGATPNKGIIFEDGGGVQADLLAHYWFGDHKIENRTLLTFDYNVYTGRSGGISRR